MDKCGIKKDGDFYYKTINKAFDDFGPVINFYFKLRTTKEYRKYIKEIGYVSHMEGTHGFAVYL